jgi:uncharacterized protein (TIGR03435 family)
VSLLYPIELAYDIGDDQLSGPDWLGTTHFDIEARMPAETTKESFQVMLRNLLAERFHFSAHFEKRNMPVYEVMVAKGGFKLKPSVDTDDPPAEARGTNGMQSDKLGFPMLPPHASGFKIENGVAYMSGPRNTLMSFAPSLRFPLGVREGEARSSVRVVDKTGIQGEYDIKLMYQWPGAAVVSPTADTGPAAAIGPDAAPTLENALQQQLGLKLEKSQQLVDFLVIDHIDRTPVGN